MDKNLIFYDIMGYNYPENKEYFYINNDLLEGVNFDIKKNKKLSSNVEEQEKIINKYKFLYKHIPFIESIYICNSLTFKSINENSDIDLFIVTKNNRIFLAKFFLWLFLKIFGMYGTHQKNKFCIGFYVDKENQDLYPISISPIDLYLAYWIAHLQLLYSESNNTKIFSENIWVKNIIPNYNFQEQKILNIQKTYGKGFIKKIFEFLFGFDFLNKLIGFFWKKRMINNKKSMGEKAKDIIISDYMLKFQAPDIRKIVYLKYKILKNPLKKKIIKKIEEKSLF